MNRSCLEEEEAIPPQLQSQVASVIPTTTDFDMLLDVGLLEQEILF